MTAESLRYRWSTADFVRADDAKVFTGRVELVDGEVWPVVIGGWHGPTTARFVVALSSRGVVVTLESLPTGDSLPDPDLWVRPANAVPTGQLSARVSTWSPADVLLVVEVSDETVLADLTVKAQLYGGAGYPLYWVVTRDAIHQHTGPVSDGYRSVRRYLPGEQIPVPHNSDTLSVTDLLGVG